MATAYPGTWGVPDVEVACALPGTEQADIIVNPIIEPEGRVGPGSSATKAEIVAWLADNGVSLSESALNSLTKSELLALVADILDA
jgi:hypothetical protein